MLAHLVCLTYETRSISHSVFLLDQFRNMAQLKPEGPAPAVDLLEEDDEFEEFALEDWSPEAEEKVENVQWQEDWDDDDIEDDFCQQLRAELEATA